MGSVNSKPYVYPFTPTEEAHDLRDSGIKVVGKVPWGTHFCQFYQDEKDLVDLLVPYFIAGLKNNEFCMWVTSEPLKVEEARSALMKVLPEAEEMIEKGQLEILDYTDWYIRSGKFNSKEILEGWVHKLKEARKKGYDGLRLTGNTHWLEANLWKDFEQYEAAVNAVIGEHKMMALCSYALGKCGAMEILDVVANHQFALVRRHGEWGLIETTSHKLVGEALRESEERFSKAFYENPAPMTITSMEDGKWQEVNESFLKMTGFSRDEVVGFNSVKHRMIIDPMVRKKIVEALNAERLVSGIEINALTKKGEKLNLLLSAAKVNLGGKPHVIAMHVDITDRKRSEEALKTSEIRFRSLFENMSEGIAIHELVESASGHEEDYRILDVNPAFESITGIPRKKAVQVLASDLYGTGEAPYLSTYAEVVRTGNPTRFEVYFQPMDKHFNISVFSPEKGKFATVFSDITAHKRLEAIIKKRAEDLEYSNARLQQFAYVASHDLQEPLRMIVNSLGILEKRSASKLDQKEIEYLDLAIDGGMRMKSLIDDLLRFSRIDSSARKLSEVRMDDIVLKTVKIFQGTIDELGGEVSWSGLPAIRADGSQMLQLMQNLIGNALKFHGSEPPRVRISGSERSDDYLFRVEDNGIGINKEYFDKIFQMFSRLNHGDEYKGNGIGLAIAQKIVETHGGKIWVESEEGKGSTFLFTIAK